MEKMSALVPGSKILGTVTHVEFDAGLCIGYCQLCEENVVDELAEAIENNVQKSASSYDNWSSDDIVLALFPEDDNWYRGKIVENGANGLLVFFVDYGNTETVNSGSIRKLPSLLKHIEPLATKCVLVDETPPNGQWTAEQEMEVKDKLLNQEFMFEIIKRSPQGFSVRMHSPSSSATSLDTLTMQTVALNSCHQCYISYTESANKFWVQLQETENDLIELMSQMTDHCLSSAEHLGSPRVGGYCIAYYSDDMAPYRSQILTSTSDKCLVQFIDYGNSESKSPGDLMKLPPKFMPFPVQGIRCCYKATKINPNKLEDKLQELMASEGGVKVKFLRRSNDEYTVEINEVEQLEGNSSMSNSQSEVQHDYPVSSLPLNQTCDVCVCYVEHPGCFYVQLLSSSDTVNDLMDLAEEEFVTSRSVSRVSPGQSCLAKMSDAGIYRGFMESTGSSISVTSVDFGFTETVDVQNLREISTKLQSIPSQCVQCTVDLTKMSFEHWSDEEINILKGFENSVPLVSMVTSSRGNVYQLDLYDTRDKDIDRYLNEELLGVKKQGKTASSYKESARRPLIIRRIQIPKPDVVVGNTEIVCVTAVHSTKQFFGQLTKVPVDKFASLQDTLTKVYEMGQDAIVDGEVGTFCCAKYTDGSWYRALITAVTGSSAEIMFIDFGDSCTVPLSSLYQIHPSIADTPQLCILCQFQKQPVNLSFGDLQSLMVDKVVEIRLLSKTDGIFPTFQIEFTNQSNNRNITSRLYGNQHKIPRLPQAALQSGTGGEKRGMVSIGDVEEVMVTHVVDPEHFHCQLSKTAPQLDALMESLDKHYSALGEDEELLTTFSLGKHCVAKYSADQDWYRAQITGMLNNGMVEVRYIDYGNTECSSKDTLKQISDELMTLPPQAVLCGLEGVASSSGFWQPEKVAQFEDLVLDQTFKATFKSQKPGEETLLCVLESADGTNINQKYGTSTNSLLSTTHDSSPNNFQQRNRFGDKPSGGRFNNSRSEFGGGSGGSSRFSKPSSGFGNAGSGDWNESPSASSSTPSFGGGNRGGFGGAGDSFGGSGGSSFGGGGGGFRKEGGGRGCHKCGEEGHFARDCPKSGGSSGGGRGCHKCGEEGHFARDCPKGGPGGGGGGRACHKCGEEGHFARDCPSGGGSRGRGCHKCGEEGHFARDCTSSGNRSSGFGGGGGSSSGFGSRGSSGGFGGRSERPSGGFSGGFNKNSSNNAADDDWGGFSVDPKPKGPGFGSRPSGGGGGGFQGGKPSGGFGGRSGEGFGGDGGGGGGFGGASAASAEDDWGDGGSATQAAPVSTPGWSATPRNTNNNSEWGHEQSNSYIHARLPSNKSVKVYVVYAKSPTEFWCQTVEKSEELEEMMEKMNEEYNGLFPKERCVHKYETGTPCVAKFSDDKRWYRGEISKVEDDKVSVYFVDYGNTETVDKSAVKAANANYMSLEVQGVKCSLSGVVSEDWSSEAIEKFEELVMDKELLADVVYFSGGVCLVKLTENGEDVAQQLSSSGLCKLSSTTVTKPSENPYPQMPQEVGKDITAYVSWIENPHSFWIQPEEKAETLENLVGELQEHYAASGNRMDNVKSGDTVVAKFSEDEAWYRAYVENIQDSNTTVRFVDYGNTDKVSKSELFKVAENFLQVPAQALRCNLSGVKPLQSGWSADTKDIMQSLVPEAVKVKFESKNPDGIWVVSLSDGDVDVAEELIQAAVARREVSSTSTASEVTSQFPQHTPLQEGSTHQVFVSHVNSPASFYCQLVQNSEKLDTLLGEIEEQAEMFDPVNSLSEGMACMAKYSADEAWYRSVIARVSGNTADVLFVDYGNSESTSKDDICNIPPGLFKLEAQAIHCRLNNPDGVGDGFEDQVADKEMTIKVVSPSPSCLTVDLFFEDGKPLSESASSTRESSSVEAPVYEHVDYAEPPGTQFKCFATYVKSPSRIYLQKDGCEGSLESMTANLQAVMGNCSSLVNPRSGQICGTVYSEDKAWYRGVIEEVNAGKAKIRFIDYGNSEEAEISSLKVVPSELTVLPPFAYPCSLHGVSPLEGEWSSEVTSQLETLIVDKELTCTFATGTEVKLEVEDKDVGKSLQEAGLVKYEESSVASEDVQPVRVNSLEKQVVPTEPVTAYVSHTDKEKFYLQLSSQEGELGEMIEKIQVHCDKSAPLSEVALGDYCCAKFTTDNSWYRAHVKDIRGDTVDVLFIDFGNSDSVSKDNLRSLGFDCPALAYHCCLSGCTSMSTQQQELFSKLTLDAEVTATFDQDMGDKYEVTLLLADGMNVNKEIIQSDGQGVSTSHSTDLSEMEERQDAASQSVIMDESHVTLDETGFSEADLNVTSNDTNDAQEEATVSSVGDLKLVGVSEEGRVEVSVSCVYSPSCFYIQQGDTTPLNNLLDQMFEFYSNAPTGSYKLDRVDINTPCAARFSDDATWYRAVIKKQVDVDKVQVMFLDHGNVEVCAIADLRRLLSRFSELPLQAVECSLAGVRAKDGPWSSEAITLFSNLTKDKTLLADIVSIGDDSSCIVQLLHMGLSISERLLEEGHGIQATTPVTISKKVKRVFSDSSDVATPSLKLSEECPAVKEEQTILYGRFQPLAVEADTEYVVSTSHSEHPESFWCHLTDNVHSLSDLMDEMLKEYSKNQKPAKEDSTELSESEAKTVSDESKGPGLLDDCTPGTSCCVHFPVDGQYYRSVIQELLNDDSIKVFFVDFGNMEVVNQCHIYELSDDYCQMPAQAVHCRLGGIASQSWDTSSCGRFEELTDDKELLLYVIEKIEDGPNIVELSDGETSITSCLIEGGYAQSDRSLEDQSIDLVSLFSPYTWTLLSLDMEYDIKVTAVESPVHFYVMLSDCNEMSKVQEEINNYVEGNPQEMSSIVEHTPCLVLNPKQKEYQRAKCLKVFSEKQIQVLLIDSGEKLTTKIDKLFNIPDSLLQIPAQVTVCALTDVFSPTGNWSKEAKLFFSDHAEFVSIMYVRHKTDCGLYKVTLDFEGQELNRLLVDLGYARAEADTTLFEQMLDDSSNLETSFNELALERQNSFGSEEDGDKVQSLNLDSTLETTDASICMCHDSTLETTGASDSFHFINVKKERETNKKDEEMKEEDEFYDAYDEEGKVTPTLEKSVDDASSDTPTKEADLMSSPQKDKSLNNSFSDTPTKEADSPVSPKKSTGVQAEQNQSSQNAEQIKEKPNDKHLEEENVEEKAEEDGLNNNKALEDDATYNLSSEDEPNDAVPEEIKETMTEENTAGDQREVTKELQEDKEKDDQKDMAEVREGETMEEVQKETTVECKEDIAEDQRKETEEWDGDTTKDQGEVTEDREDSGSKEVVEEESREEEESGHDQEGCEENCQDEGEGSETGDQSKENGTDCGQNNSADTDYDDKKEINGDKEVEEKEDQDSSVSDSAKINSDGDSSKDSHSLKEGVKEVVQEFGDKAEESRELLASKAGEGTD